MRNLLKIIALSAYVTVGTAAFAQDKQIKIYGLDIAGLHQKDGNGIYDQVLSKVSKQGVDIDVRVVPPKRAFKLLEECASCCITPANKNSDFYDYGDDYITTDPIFVAKVFAWTLPDAPEITTLSELQGKRIGARIGMPYGKSIEKANINFDYVSDIETNIKKLKSKRLDAFIGYTSDAFTAFETLGEPIYTHAADKPLAVHSERLLCKKSPETKKFIMRFNNALSVMRRDGSLVEIVGKQN